MTSSVSHKVIDDDKRLLWSKCDENGTFIEVSRKSEKQWHECKYCYEKAPTFILTERLGKLGKGIFHISIMRCCWQCGSGLERLYDK